MHTCNACHCLFCCNVNSPVKEECQEEMLHSSEQTLGQLFSISHYGPGTKKKIKIEMDQGKLLKQDSALKIFNSQREQS